MNKLYNVGAYVRLSVDSASYDSDSVENQKSMLSKFITMMPGWVETKYYVDDGATGGNFNRKGFQEMISDARNGIINLVLVKDLSRFGRNYLEAGHYLEDVLPSLGCRFVSLMENIDTEGGENDIMPFLNAMNDYYLKNHSDRIRSIMAAKAKDGQKISGHAPYGFRRSPIECTRLIIDEYSAGIVRRIFDMRKQGVGFYTIAKTLNTEGILPPMKYYLTTAGRDDSHVKSHTWRSCYFNEMTKNELYIGNAVQFEKMIVSHRDKREVSRPADEHIRVDGAFPAIIDRETWDAVQSVNKQASERFAKKRAPEQRLFTGLLFCGDCGAKMVSIKDRRSGKKWGQEYHVSYLCGKYHTTATGECTRHSVSEAPLSKLISERLEVLIEQVRLDEKAVIKILTDKLVGDMTAGKAQRRQERNSLRQRIHKLEFTITKLYEDRVTGTLSSDTSAALIKKNEAERQESEKRLSLLEASEQEAVAKLGDIKKWVRLIKQKSTFDTVDRDLLDSLIDRIEIGEGRKVNGVKEQDIRIYFKFIGASM